MPVHAGFIIASYVVTAIVLGGMVVATLLDHRAQKRALALLSDRLARDDASRPAGTPARREAIHEP